ncbi:hypothetical protein K450DRAFT_226932 [Umbelopsis ramanniana AG]|uniref:Uncharacterized protein n=1 Tax=Umbelopsis ramanniana AG TaxID=1314678 RepID=A0AAD5HFU7_UMBRA|nr:uncharacterized protein K450DRAFT_226932 [Umbelopsis ramanniana AG]KAI8582795.1 hypothetical protein K450DRAFT_226932 [Umbelopsis ramanniana AG]
MLCRLYWFSAFRLKKKLMNSGRTLPPFMAFSTSSSSISLMVIVRKRCWTLRIY